MFRRLIILLLIIGCEEVLVPKDCAGVAGGTAVLDNCGVCDTDLSNDCVPDCAGVWGGTSVDDCNGVCGGSATLYNDGSCCNEEFISINQYCYYQSDANALQSIIDLASKKFEIKKSDSAINPQEPNMFGMYCQGEWYYLKSKIDSYDSQHPTQLIDADILANNFLNPILSILDSKTDKRINFVG